ncbi:hypothetical protein K469DRAFT_723381 [Zopfia rhizophila CBS 207.26]|uniref:Uncharacterized protein n=1 Tax=Zopfia rhizophila CBS 207.26 TaxID=1314779 RepID=A0A6A6DDL2_9PEZI|nr:hypothetical protein K469DRAFT_723381 [Zopfia rhizophila CBS 207.26]
MLGAYILYNINKQLYMLRGSAQDFSGIPIIIFLEDFHHAKKFTTIVILKKQICAAADLRLQQLLTRVRRIPWESGITNGQPTEEEAFMILSYGDDSSILIPAVFMFVPGIPVVNGASYTALDVVVDKAHPGHLISTDTILHLGPPAGVLLTGELMKDLHLVDMPPGTILLTPISVKMECQRRQPWQRTDVSCRGLPCTAAFACTDYKVQGRTLERVALELRGTRMTNIDGRAGIMLLLKARERDIIGNTIPENMVMAEKRLEELSEVTIREVES